MMKLFCSHPEAVTNTSLIAERCNVIMNLDSSIKLLKFQVESITDNDFYFRSMCEKGLVKRYGSNITHQIRERFEHELKIIPELHSEEFSLFFLIFSILFFLGRFYLSKFQFLFDSWHILNIFYFVRILILFFLLIHLFSIVLLIFLFRALVGIFKAWK